LVVAVLFFLAGDFAMVLVTGISGFLGGHLWRHLHDDAVGISGGSLQPSIDGEVLAIDLTDRAALKQLLRRLSPTVIIHTAAWSDLNRCEAEPAAARQINALVPMVLAEYCGRNRCRLIHLSSDMVYDGRRGNYRETDKTAPLSVYGRTKVEAEQLVRDSCPNHVIIRSALIYGRPFYGGTSFSEWMEAALRRKDLLSLYVDQYRTPIWVENLAAALVELTESDFVGTLHLGGANRIDRFAFGQQLCRTGGYPESLLQPVSMDDHQQAAPRPRDVSLCIDRARQVLRTPLLDTETGLQFHFARHSSPESGSTRSDR